MWSTLCYLFSPDGFGPFVWMGVTILGVRLGGWVFNKIMEAYNRF